MADARALLKAKRLERGAGPKPRIAAVRSTAKDEEHLRKGKRKLESPITTMDARASSPALAAPSVDAITEPPSDKRRRIDESMSGDSPSAAGAAGFPTDFFSDASRSLPIGDDNDGSENGHEEDSNTATSHTVSAPSHPSSHTTQPNPPPSSIDDEFAAFERAMQAAAQPPKRDAQHAAFAKATVAAEPELIADTATSGFPPAIDDESRGGEPNNAADASAEVEETEIDQRRRKQEEERELIMDRLLDEERAQEEADAKVNALKARLEAIKLKRAAKKAGGK